MEFRVLINIVCLDFSVFSNETLTQILEDKWLEISSELFRKSFFQDELVREEIRNFYFGKHSDIDENSWATFTRLLSDWLFVKGITDLSHLHAAHATTYGYVFTFQDGFSFSVSQPHLPAGKSSDPTGMQKVFFVYSNDSRIMLYLMIHYF